MKVNLTGTVLHHKKKKEGAIFFPGSKSICRGDLSKALLDEAKKTSNVTVHFGCTFSKMDADRR